MQISKVFCMTIMQGNQVPSRYNASGQRAAVLETEQDDKLGVCTVECNKFYASPKEGKSNFNWRDTERPNTNSYLYGPFHLQSTFA